MVRLKQRYIFFDILYPPAPPESSRDKNRDDFYGFSESQSSALLSLHKASPSTINPKTITQTTRKVIEDHFGDVGAGTVGLLLTVKYFSNKTSSGIIRCSRQNHEMVVAALSLMNNIQGMNVIVRCPHISGTIRKCQDFSIRRNKKMLLLMKDKLNSAEQAAFYSNFQIENDNPSEIPDY